MTFEFEERPPVTLRGTLAGSQVATCVARAIRKAQADLRPRNWSSMNCVVLERVYEAGETVEPTIRDAASPEVARATISA